jgi:putative membrane protein
MKYSLLAVAVVTGWFVGQANAADKELPLPTDQKFLAKAIECTVAEEKFADTAIARTTNADVKQFAQKIKNEHEQCRKQLMEEAAKHKLAVVQGLDKEHREAADRLNRLEGKAFDQEYVRGLIARHQKAIQFLEHQAKQGQVAEIKALAEKTLPKLKAHLEDARKLEEKLKS